MRRREKGEGVVQGAIIPEIEWEAAYRTGVDDIDNRHKRLFDLFGSFARAINQRLGPEITEEAMDALLVNFIVAATGEECLMAETGYSGFSEHREEHDLLVLTLRAISQPSSMISTFGRPSRTRSKRWKR